MLEQPVDSLANYLNHPSQKSYIRNAKNSYLGLTYTGLYRTRSKNPRVLCTNYERFVLSQFSRWVAFTSPIESWCTVFVGNQFFRTKIPLKGLGTHYLPAVRKEFRCKDKSFLQKLFTYKYATEYISKRAPQQAGEPAFPQQWRAERNSCLYPIQVE